MHTLFTAVYHAYTNSSITPHRTAHLTSLQKVSWNKTIFLYKEYIQMKRNTNTLSHRVGIEHLTATPKAKQNFEQELNCSFTRDMSRHPLKPLLCSRTRRPRSAGWPPPHNPSRLLESWSQSVSSHHQKIPKKTCNINAPLPFTISSSANPRATALGQKVLEGTSLFPPSDKLWAVNIDVQLGKSDQQTQYQDSCSGLF
jgi:hypothetical protein